MDQSTLGASESAPRPGRAEAERVPGLVLSFSAGVPRALALPLVGGTLELGRADTGDGGVDRRVSRRHARVSFDGRRFVVSDLGSQNGTYVDGERLPSGGSGEVERVLRLGDSLFLPMRDVRAIAERGVRVVDGFVRGPAMQALLEQAALLAQSGSTLHVRGETGTGKEGIARAFHAAGAGGERGERAEAGAGGGGAARPFVAVNCAAIPPNLAERLLFGAKRGAYSGADADAAGYFAEADGGTLFLDEVAELDLQVQAKLLRALETNEVLPLGAARARRVDVRFCSATNADLRGLVAAGKLREDLYFRIGRPDVVVPALRNRPEEIPFLVGEALRRTAAQPVAHVLLVEQALRRPWPGNVRELLVELRAAAQTAAAAGSARVLAQHLGASSGTMFAASGGGGGGAAIVAEEGAGETAPRRRMPQVDEEWRRRIEEALRANKGNVAASARTLGLHRNQLRRLLERHGLAAEDDGADSPPD